MNTRIQTLVDKLQLSPHPEGGWFRETWRAEDELDSAALPARFAGNRSCGTAIYFLLAGDDFSALHRIASDELWHFYAGSTLLIHVLAPDGSHRVERLGADLSRGDRFQLTVPHGCWFGAALEAPHSYALVGCTVSPGFDFADFEMGRQDDLFQLFPQHHELIAALTRQ